MARLEGRKRDQSDGHWENATEPMTEIDGPDSNVRQMRRGKGVQTKKANRAVISEKNTKKKIQSRQYRCMHRNLRLVAASPSKAYRKV
jgi:hypothetical protein